MFFDSKKFGLVDLAIAIEIAKKIDDGQPKPKLIDSVKRWLGTALNITTTILGRQTRRANVTEALSINSQRFAQDVKH